MIPTLYRTVWKIKWDDRPKTCGTLPGRKQWLSEWQLLLLILPPGVCGLDKGVSGFQCAQPYTQHPGTPELEGPLRGYFIHPPALAPAQTADNLFTFKITLKIFWRSLWPRAQCLRSPIAAWIAHTHPGLLQRRAGRERGLGGASFGSCFLCK